MFLLHGHLCTALENLEDWLDPLSYRPPRGGDFPLCIFLATRVTPELHADLLLSVLRVLPDRL